MGRLGEFRIALTAADYDKTLSFYRNALGLTVLQEWPSQDGRGSLLSLGNATLEILDEAHAAWVDRIEVGRRVSGPVRFALKFSDLDLTLKSAVGNGARIFREPALTPWNDISARIEGPDGMQMTFFASREESGQ